MINRDNIFTWPPAVFFWALICALLWGSAFPMVKTGFVMLDIQHSTGGKLYFAAYRFLLAGLMIFAGILISGKSIRLSHKRDYGAMVLTGLLQTTLQYTLFYIGLCRPAFRGPHRHRASSLARPGGADPGLSGHGAYRPGVNSWIAVDHRGDCDDPEGIDLYWTIPDTIPTGGGYHLLSEQIAGRAYL